MSLRTRLTLLYSIMMGVILLVFGTAAFLLINILLLNQVDDKLALLSVEVAKQVEIDSMGNISLNSLLPPDVASSPYVQLWGSDGVLMDASQGLGLLAEPLDPIGLRLAYSSYRENNFQGTHLRVLTVPLVLGGRDVGHLQVGASLEVADATLGNLVNVMSAAGLLAVILVALASWLILNQALAPLENITETVDQINRADDLSRRIPVQYQADSEIADLIESFNQTLERLESLFTSQQRFLADVSHELRTPLTVIKGNVGLMRRMKQIDDESLTSIDQEAGRLTRLVGGLLLLAQADSGKLTLNLQPVDMDMLVVEVFQEISILAGTKVRVHLKEIDQLCVKGDRDRLKQVILNLTANAIQYTPQGGEVFLSLAKVGDQARIVVRDTGPGIPSEDLPHIFERFYRAEKSRTRSKAGGFGLGLSITQWIVEHHGGRIEVESKEGKGTTFVIWMPVFLRE